MEKVSSLQSSQSYKHLRRSLEANSTSDTTQYNCNLKNPISKVLDEKEEDDSNYTQYLKPFKIKLQSVYSTKISKILKKEVDKVKNETLLIFQIHYEGSQDNSLDKDIENENFEWEIYKTCQEIKCLFSLIRFDRSSVSGLIEDRETLLNIERFMNACCSDYEKDDQLLIKLLETINCLLQIPKIRDKIIFLEFLEISRYSFDCFNQGNKPKEGYILKKSWSKRDNSYKSIIKSVFCICKNSWQTCWFVVKDDMICYLDNSSSNIGKDIFWFDQELIIQKDYNRTPNSLCLINGSRFLLLKFQEEYQREIWFEIISKKVIEYQNKTKNNFDSFAFKKTNCNARWFVDSENYFEDLYYNLLKAKESIYIAGWWVSPELFLKRPIDLKFYQNAKSLPDEDFLKNSTRLMDVLKRKAEQGVEVHLLIFKEVKLALSNNSNHTKNIFDNLHPNIKVTRHPKNTLDLLWSHHEKLVIIDQKVGYVGGLDLCWGRFDRSNHTLVEEEVLNREILFPGVDYSNPRIKDFENVNEYLNDIIDRKSIPRMPWHDVHICLEGPVVSDLCRHFVERWNFARTSTAMNSKKNSIFNVKNGTRSNSKISFTMSASTNMSTKTKNYGFKPSRDSLTDPLITETQKNQTIMEDPLEEIEPDDSFGKGNSISKNILNSAQEHMRNSKCNFRSSEIFLKKRHTFVEQDFDNQILNPLKSSTSNLKSLVKRNTIGDGSSYKKNSLINNTYTGNNDNNPDCKSSKVNILDQLKDKFNNLKDHIKAKSNKMKVKLVKKFFNKNFGDTQENMMNIRINPKKYAIQGDQTCHVVRSACEWSAGLYNNVENSILKAYYSLIDNAKHYIFIENQFFISKTFTDDESVLGGTRSSSVINEIVLHIRQRIERAFEEKQKFRVFVFIPLLPGFAGEVHDTSTLQIILKYTYKTISRNRGLSLMEKLYQLMMEGFEDYIHFFSLRTHGVINGMPKTEMIYIHSKLLIVDDRTVLIGSANVNDRSMLGSRDSEIGVIIEENDKIISKMNGEEYTASRFAQSLRIRLMKEHLGFPDLDKDDFPEALLDPLDDQLFTMMKQISRTNTILYREIFNCYPDDTFERFEDILGLKSFACEAEEVEYYKKLKTKYHSLKSNIIGNLVDFPLDFLKEENLNRSYFCKEILVPIKNFL